MSRQTNVMGLSLKAKQFIENNKLKSTIWFNDCKDTVTGMFDEDVWDIQFYYEYGVLKYKDYVQAEHWSSGPCIFIALWDIKNDCPVKETLWDEEEIINY